MQAFLRANPSAEQRQSIKQILEAIAEVRSPDGLRQQRAVEVLERIGTAEARDLLQKLAKGMPEARLTREAQNSLLRLGGR